MCVNGNNIVVQPISTDVIRGNAAGASVTVSGAGTGLWLVCAVPGYWDIVNSSSGGGSTQPFNTNIDLHTNTPNNLANDEFEYGSTVDTTGARFASAIPWTLAYSNGTPTVNVAAGNLIVSNMFDYAMATVWTQPITNSAGNWEFTAKVALSYAYQYNSVGLYLLNSGSTNGYEMVITGSGGPWGTSSTNYLVQRQTGFAFVANDILQAWNGAFLDYGGGAAHMSYWYVRLSFDTATYTLSSSLSGLPGTFSKHFSTTTTNGFIGTADKIGIVCSSVNNPTPDNAAACIIDWFRRTV
jgi:hypothetical protein